MDTSGIGSPEEAKLERDDAGRIRGRFGPYEVVELLGVGGMGEVYRAHDARLGRDVALKVVAERFLRDPPRLERFEREARILASLSHPNVATLYGMEESDGVHALVLELVEGETLDERLAAARGRGLPIRQALDLARQIADALDAAHQHGIVHRDLKPSNIALRSDGTVKVLDFGIAKALGSAADDVDHQAQTELTAVGGLGTFLGTVDYMSPEQARGLAVDKRTDIWAFGCVLYEMLTGLRAFPGESPPEVVARLLEREPDFGALPAATPPVVRRLLRRCLYKDPRQRLRDMGDACFEITEQLDAIDGRPTAAALEAGGAAAPRSLVTMTSRRSVLAGGTALALLGAGAGTGLLLHERLRPGAPPAYHRLTFRRGMIRTARFAPDYQTVLYGALFEGDECRVYMVRPESPESNALSLPAATPLAVSASGEVALALGTHLRGIMTYGTLARVPLAGGVPREVLEGVKYADWSPDGSELAVVRHEDGRDLLEFPLGRVIAEPDSSRGGFSFPRVSRDGQRVACFELTAAGGLTGYVVVVNRLGHKRIASQRYFNCFGLAWRDEEIWFTAADERPLFRNTIQAMRPGDAPRVVARIPGNASLHDVAPDGRLLVAHTNDRTGTAIRAPGEQLERDLSWLDATSGPAISRDGRMLLFTESGVGGGPSASVYLRSSAGSPAVRLGDGYAVALSADARWAVVSPEPQPLPSPHLDLLPTGAGRARRIARVGWSYFDAQWLPDGQRLVVHAQEQAGAPGLYVLDLQSETHEVIMPLEVGTGDAWALSPDGAMVAVTSDRGIEIHAVDGNTRARPVAGTMTTQRLLAWIDSGLLVSDDPDPQALSTIMLVDPESGRRELWNRLAPCDPAGVMNVGGFSVTADGRGYAYRFHRSLSDLYLVRGLS